MLLYVYSSNLGIDPRESLLMVSIRVYTIQALIDALLV